MGMGGFSFALVVVDPFNIKSIFSVKTENDAPSLLIQPRRRPGTHRCPLPQLLEPAPDLGRQWPACFTYCCTKN
jgi:hypothetical protein